MKKSRNGWVAAAARSIVAPLPLMMIGEVIAGTQPGRTSDTQRTVYRSLGVAAQDLAAADFIVARAIERKCGVEVAWH